MSRPRLLWPTSTPIGRSNSKMATFVNKEIAAKAGHVAMGRRTSAQKTGLGERGGNSLVRQQGTGYYASLGIRSAALRMARRDQSAPPVPYARIEEMVRTGRRTVDILRECGVSRWAVWRIQKQCRGEV